MVKEKNRKYYNAPILGTVVVDNEISMMVPSDPPIVFSSKVSSPATIKSTSPLQATSPSEESNSPFGGDLPQY